MRVPGKHGRGTGGAAPASDVAGHGDAQGTPLPARPAASGHVDPTWVSSTRANASRFGFDARRRKPIRADSGLNRPESAGIGQNRPVSAGIGRYQPISAETAETADSGRNSKKKKKPRTHRLLNSNPTSAQMHSKRQKHSSHYISLTLNLVYVCIM